MPDTSRKYQMFVKGREYRVKDTVKIVDIKKDHVMVEDTNPEPGAKKESWAIAKRVFADMYEMCEF